MDINQKPKNVVRVKLNEKFKDSKNRTVIIVPKSNVEQSANKNEKVIKKEKKKRGLVMGRFKRADFKDYQNMSIEQKIEFIEVNLRYVSRSKRIQNKYLIINEYNRILENLYEEKSKQLISGNNNTGYDMNINKESKETVVEDFMEDKGNISLDIDVRTEAYKKLSDEKKINVVRNKLTKLFENPGNKTISVVYNGQKKKINRDKQGEYKDLVERENKLKDIINKKENDDVQVNGVTKVSFYDRRIIPFVDKTTNKVDTLLKKITKQLNKKNKINKVKKEKNKKTKKDKSLKTKIVVAWVAFKGKFKKENKNSETLVNKDKNKKIRRRLSAAYCALLIFVTGFMLSRCNKDSNACNNSVVGGMSQDNNDNVNNNTNINNENNNNKEEDKENNNNNNDNTDEEDKENNNNNNDNTDEEDKENNNNNNDNTDEDDKENNNNNNDNTDEDDKENNNNNNDNTDEDDKENNNNNNDNTDEDEFKLTLDDTVTINKNSYIYTNSYDATYNTNSLKPYYGGYHERDVQGLVYSLDGKIYVIYETDVDAMEKQRELENAGAIMTAVLVTRNDMTNTGEYEGYYNISSVKVKTRK